MRRSLSVRISVLVFVAMMSFPAMAAPRGDDSPIGGIERAISRIMEKIERLLQPLDLPVISFPK
jgi:hypothetical protein